MKRLLYNAIIFNRGKCFPGFIEITGSFITNVSEGTPSPDLIKEYGENVENLQGRWIFPGVIDDQVHFRDPGLTHKGNIESESRAAVAGGVTSYLDMPNTKPATTDLDSLNKKNDVAAHHSLANYGFFIGATNDNIDVLSKIDYSQTPGIKLFLGSSTGNMLVDDESALDKIFSLTPIIAIHSEDESIIRNNILKAKDEFGEKEIPIEQHPQIRSEEACYVSTQHAIQRAEKFNTRLHILHLSTAREIELLSNKSLESKRITAEVCVHHLWFDNSDYQRYGAKIKCNPAIKTAQDRNALREALQTGLIDIIATDHAPHLIAEKEGDCLHAASGIPLVQHSLVAMLELAGDNVITPEDIVQLMCHNPAILYRIVGRGFIEKGMYADLTVIDPNSPWTVEKSNILYKCGWSPFEGHTFKSKVIATYINGKRVYSDGKFIPEPPMGMRLTYDQTYK